jgi:hypothetical protein
MGVLFAFVCLCTFLDSCIDLPTYKQEWAQTHAHIGRGIIHEQDGRPGTNVEPGPIGRRPTAQAHPWPLAQRRVQPPSVRLIRSPLAPQKRTPGANQRVMRMAPRGRALSQRRLGPWEETGLGMTCESLGSLSGQSGMSLGLSRIQKPITRASGAKKTRPEATIGLQPPQTAEWCSNTTALLLRVLLDESHNDPVDGGQQGRGRV